MKIATNPFFLICIFNITLKAKTSGKSRLHVIVVLYSIRVVKSPDCRSQCPRFETRRSTNVLWKDIDLHLPHSTQVM